MDDSGGGGDDNTHHCRTKLTGWLALGAELLYYINVALAVTQLFVLAMCVCVVCALQKRAQ